jgi:CRP/FNR family cyclic AMP-dependent transcriptional regulator
MESGLPDRFIRTYQKSQVVFAEGSLGKEMYVIYSGKVNLYADMASGKGKLLANIEAGDFFGEMALVDDSPRSATAIADEDNTQLVVLDQNRFTYLLLHQPDFALLVMGTLCQRLREANKALALNEMRHGG